MASQEQALKEMIKKVFTEMLGELMKEANKGIFSKAKGTFKEMKGAFKDKSKLKTAGLMFKGIGEASGAGINAMMSFMDALGIAQPILDVLTGLMSMFSGVLLEKLMPVFMELFDVLLSPDVIEIIMILADIFATLLIPLIRIFVFVLKLLIPVIKVILQVIQFLLLPLKYIGVTFKVIGLVLAWLGKVVLTGFIFMLYGFALAIVGLIWLITFGTVNLFSGINSFFGSMIGMALAMQHGGIVTRPTLALIGEAGPEAVIPLNEMGMGEGVESNQKVIWALEDNGDKLDLIYMTLKSGGRLR